MFGILHIPFQGSWGLMSMLTALFVVATQALGLFLFSLFPAISLIISIVSMVGSLGATLSGVTFPVPNMYPLKRNMQNTEHDIICQPPYQDINNRIRK